MAVRQTLGKRTWRSQARAVPHVQQAPSRAIFVKNILTGQLVPQPKTTGRLLQQRALERILPPQRLLLAKRRWKWRRSSWRISSGRCSLG